MRGAAVMSVTDAAREMVLAVRAEEADPESLSLFVEVNGESAGAYTYDIWFQLRADAGPDDAVAESDGLSTVVPASSVDKLAGATLDVGEVDGEPSLVIVNPNLPPSMSRPAPRPEADLTSPVARAVLAVLEEQVNPSIAMHGGRADLVAVEDNVAYLSLSGGCQGCGLASVTLSQGIAVALQEAVPEITEVVDVTDHAGGSNPYYEPAKK
jgi:Fe/S biogenesis protein NfuA